MSAREGVTALGLVSTMVGGAGYLIVGFVQDWGWAFAAAGVMAGLLVAMFLLLPTKGEERWGAIPVSALAILVGAPITVPVFAAFFLLMVFTGGNSPF